MIDAPGELVIVARPADPVAAGVRRVVAGLGGSVAWYSPGELAALNVELTEAAFNVAQRTVRTVLWRVSPDMPLAESFCDGDRSFACAEVAATWIAGLNPQTTAVINRFDADAWYSGLRPQYWRDRLQAAGIGVTEIRVADQPVPADWQWSPYTTGEPCELPEQTARAVMASVCHCAAPLVPTVALCGEVMTGCRDTNVQRAAAILDGWGVGLAALDSDADGRVHRVRVLPVFDDPSLLERVTAVLGGRLYDHCAARRS